MGDSESKNTLIMEVIESLNNRIIPLDYPKDGFLSPEVMSGVIDAMNYNDTAPIYLSLKLYFYEYGKKIQLNYMPYDFYPELVPVPASYVFKVEDINNYYNSPYAWQLYIIEGMNRALQYAHKYGYNPHFMKVDGKYYTDCYTSKNHHIYPLSLHEKVLDYRPTKISLHDVFNIPKPVDTAATQIDRPLWERDIPIYAFDIGSIIRESSVHKTSDVKSFLASSLSALIIKSEGMENPPLYYDKNLYYVNPLYGYKDNFEFSHFWGGDVKMPEWKGDKVPNSYEYYGDFLPSELLFNSAGWYSGSANGTNIPEKSRYVGIILTRGFSLLWATDTEFYITQKTMLIYRDRLKENYKSIPPTCCLAECFGITE